MSVTGAAPKGATGESPVVGKREAASVEWPWDQLYRDLAPGLIALGVRRFDLASADCEDAFQKAAMDIAEAGPAARSREAYLTACFLRECLRIAQRKRVREPFQASLESADRLSDDPVERIEASIVFHSAMSRVPVRCRKIIRAHALEGRDILESARVSQWNLANAHRGFKRCWKMLSDAIV